MKKQMIYVGILVILSIFAASAAKAEEGLYILDGMGGVYTVGTMEVAPQGPYFGWNIARDLALSPMGEGYYVLSGDGEIHAVGGAEPISSTVFGFDIARKLVFGSRGHYVLDGYGVIHAFDGAPKLSFKVLSEPIAVDFELTADGRGGYVLDGLGGIHPVGEAPPIESMFFGWNIARDLVLNSDGSYYVLDGFGGIYSSGTALINGPFFNEDIARRLSVSPSSGGAYLLDAQGGVHALGGAPELPNSNRPGWDVVVDFELSSAAEKIGTIKGIIERQSSDSVSLSSAEVQEMIVRLENTGHSGSINSDGSFSLQGVPEGSYTLLVESANRPDLKLRLQNIQVTRGVTLDLGRLQLIPTGSISGKATLEGESDYLGTDVYIAGTSLLAKTDHDGEFKISYVPQGRYNLIIERPGFARVEIQLVSVAPGTDTAIGEVELKKIETTRTGSIAGFVYRRLNGQEQERRNDSSRLIPVPGAEVVLHREASSTRNAERYFQTMTDSRGAYSFETVPAGAYKIKTIKGGSGSGEEDIVVEAGKCTEQNIILSNYPDNKGKLVGTVIEDTGVLSVWNPIAGAKVTVKQPGQTTKSAYTNRLGQYIIEGVQPGLRVVYAEKEGFAKQTQSAHIRPWQETKVDFRLRPMITDTGTVFGVVKGLMPVDSTNTSTEQPLPRALVVLYPEGDRPEFQADGQDDYNDDRFITRFSDWTDELGQYRIPEVPAGRYKIVAFKSGFDPERHRINICAGCDIEQNFLLMPKQTQLGSVKGLIMEDLMLDVVIPIPGATVAMMNMEGQMFRVTHSDEEGRYSFPDVPEGRYFGLAEKEGYIPKRKEFTVEAGEEEIVNFALKRIAFMTPGVIHGQVTDSEGCNTGDVQPVEGAKVILLPRGVRCRDDCDDEYGLPHKAPLRIVQTDCEGRYLFEDVIPGRYAVCVQALGYHRMCQELTVLPDQSVELNFALVRADFGSFAGVTFTADNLQEERMPLPRVTILLLPPIAISSDADCDLDDFLPKALQIMKSDECGEFKFDQVGTGWVLVAAFKEGYRPQFQLAEIRTDETTFKEIWLKPKFFRRAVALPNKPKIN